MEESSLNKTDPPGYRIYTETFHLVKKEANIETDHDEFRREQQKASSWGGNQRNMSFFFFFSIYLFGWPESQLQHVKSSSLTRDGTQAPCMGSVES